MVQPQERPRRISLAPLSWVMDPSLATRPCAVDRAAARLRPVVTGRGPMVQLRDGAFTNGSEPDRVLLPSCLRLRGRTVECSVSTREIRSGNLDSARAELGSGISPQGRRFHR